MHGGPSSRLAECLDNVVPHCPQKSIACEELF